MLEKQELRGDKEEIDMAATDKQKFWGRWITTGAVLGILGFLGSFLFSKVVAMPENYPTKTEVNAVEIRVNTKIDTEVDHMRKEQAAQMKAVETGIQQIIRAQEELHKDVREIRSKIK